MSSGTTANDPNGWVKNPPTVMVKISNTSRDVLNGQYGIVVGWAQDRGRYIIHLAVKQEQISLKPENVQKCSFVEQFIAQFQLLRHNPQVQQQLYGMYRALQSRLPDAVKPEHVGVTAVLLLLLSVYFLGFSRTLTLLSFLIMVGLVIGPDLVAGCDLRTVARNAPSRWNSVVRTQLPYVGPKIASNKYLSAGLAAFVIFVSLNALLVGGGGARRKNNVAATKANIPPASPASSFSSANNLSPKTTAATVSSSSTTTSFSKADIERFYKLGFEDANQENEFGASLQSELETMMKTNKNAPRRVVVDTEATGNDAFNEEWRTQPPQAPSKGGGGMWGRIGSIMPLFMIGKTVHQLGQQPDGSWNAAAAKQNLRTLEPMKLGLLGFSCYRLFKSIF